VADPIAAAQQAADELRSRSGVDSFDAAVVLGSGWKAAAGLLGETLLDVATTDLPGFAPSTVLGHEGRVAAVRNGDRHVLVFRGRTHLYEGRGVDPVAHGVRTAVAAGCKTVVLTNACGGIEPSLGGGSRC
jgi:purine-nucleoside phosphorylase